MKIIVGLDNAVASFELTSHHTPHWSSGYTVLYPGTMERNETVMSLVLSAQVQGIEKDMVADNTNECTGVDLFQ